MQVRRFNPFGQGLRNCLGQQLARMNVPTAIAMFVANFKLELTPEVGSISHPNQEISISAGNLVHCFVLLETPSESND